MLMKLQTERLGKEDARRDIWSSLGRRNRIYFTSELGESRNMSMVDQMGNWMEREKESMGTYYRYCGAFVEWCWNSVVKRESHGNLHTNQAGAKVKDYSLQTDIMTSLAQTTSTQPIDHEEVQLVHDGTFIPSFKFLGSGKVLCRLLNEKCEH